jgi:UDP-N-acetylglucosamine 2-epimerase (non-hydrolysing)
VLSASRYALLTLHRASNVDDSETLSELLDTVLETAHALPVVWPVHPRTRARIEQFQLQAMLNSPRLLMTGPIGYLPMLGLMQDAAVVLTDSGGMQEETTALGVPCITLRENTERPITVSEGTNTLAGRDATIIRETVAEVLRSGGKRGRIPELWDGKAAERIAAVLAERL